MEPPIRHNGQAATHPRILICAPFDESLSLFYFFSPSPLCPLEGLLIDLLQGPFASRHSKPCSGSISSPLSNGCRRFLREKKNLEGEKKKKKQNHLYLRNFILTDIFLPPFAPAFFYELVLGRSPSLVHCSPTLCDTWTLNLDVNLSTLQPRKEKKKKKHYLELVGRKPVSVCQCDAKLPCLLDPVSILMDIGDSASGVFESFLARQSGLPYGHLCSQLL